MVILANVKCFELEGITLSLSYFIEELVFNMSKKTTGL